MHLVTCAVNAAQNIEKCVERCGLTVDGIILEQLASSYSVITEDERDLGVAWSISVAVPLILRSSPTAPSGTQV